MDIREIPAFPPLLDAETVDGKSGDGFCFLLLQFILFRIKQMSGERFLFPELALTSISDEPTREAVMELQCDARAHGRALLVDSNFGPETRKWVADEFGIDVRPWVYQTNWVGDEGTLKTWPPESEATGTAAPVDQTAYVLAARARRFIEEGGVLPDYHDSGLVG